MARGNPVIGVRLEPHVVELLREKIPQSERGRAGGVSQYIKTLVYEHLGLGQPPRYAAEPSPRKKRKPAGP
jgi:hypothetical protein